MSASVVTILCAVLAIVHRLPTRTIVTVIVPKLVGLCKGPARPNDGRLRRGCGMESLQSGSLFRASRSLARPAPSAPGARPAPSCLPLGSVRSDEREDGVCRSGAARSPEGAVHVEGHTVPPYNTCLVVDALIKANKDFA